MNLQLKSRPEDTHRSSSISQVMPDVFEERLARYRRVLYFVAYRVLQNPREAEDAVQRCFVCVSGHVPLFESEGSFRSWLVRALIDEALAILHKREERVGRFWRLDSSPASVQHRKTRGV